MISKLSLALQLRALIHRLAEHNEVYLRGGKFPRLYESGVKYVHHTEAYSDCFVALQKQEADICSLVAWRVAELWNQGERDAKAVVQWSGDHVTVKVRRADGTIEDVYRLMVQARPEKHQ